jgi:hypothetical protein
LSTTCLAIEPTSLAWRSLSGLAFGAHQVQQRRGDVGGLARRAGNPQQPFTVALGLIGLRQQQFGGAGNDRQRRPELVGNIGIECLVTLDQILQAMRVIIQCSGQLADFVVGK